MGDLGATSEIVCAADGIQLESSISKAKKWKSKVCICVVKGIQCFNGKDS